MDGHFSRQVGLSSQHRWWHYSERAASIAVIAVGLLLPTLAVWGATVIYSAGLRTERAVGASRAFEQARYALGAEESLERKYRLDPSPAIRQRHHEASDALATALGRVADIEGPADTLRVAAVLDLNARYMDSIGRQFAAMDAGDAAKTRQIDEGETDPLFGELEKAVIELADRHSAVAESGLAVFGRVGRQSIVIAPLILGLGIGLAAFFWRMLWRAQQQTKTGLRREAAATSASERRFRSLVQNASDAILVCAASGRIVYQSSAAEGAWDYKAEALLGRLGLDLTHPDDRAALTDLWSQVLEPANAASRRTELRLCDGSGEWRYAELIATNLLNDPALTGIVITIRDITERKCFEQQLAQQAFYDSLTGLPNRVLFRDRLEQALVRAGRRRNAVGVLFLDLNNFKLINDSLGHQVGDELLTQAAARLRAAVRMQDTVARLGGDEFVVVLETLNGEADALSVAKMIATQFAQPFLLHGREVVVTASIGVAVSDTGEEHAESLLRDADIAMYRAKGDGRARCVVFEASMHIDSLARLEIENDLRRALDRSELRVHYQPIVGMGSTAVHEVEALVRWQHPTRGLVSPADFIPVAEETGLIIPLGRWVLTEACNQLAEWKRRWPDMPRLTLSVNLSPRQFQHADLVADVESALAVAGLQPSCLKLEITEGVIMHDTESTIRTMWQLKNLGVNLAIDDFGTGYSSLSYLKRLPLDVLKIDRSFISGIGQSAEDTAIVHAILALAKSLNLSVTGEGIETAEQAALLADWGCDRGQGYLFGRPQNADAMADLLLPDGRQALEAARG